MRPRQWSKNAVVFTALVFSVSQEWQLRKPWTWDDLLLRAAITFGIFYVVSGADYLVNDARDRMSDRFHPRKSQRPIAAGLLSPAEAYVWAGTLWIISSVFAFAIDWRTGLVVLGYIGIMLAYTYVLKHEVILDVMAIAAGFVLRAMAGAYAIDVPISPWLYVVTGLGALFLAITKRRAEVVLLRDEATLHRQTLSLNTPSLLDQMTSMVTASTVIAYALYLHRREPALQPHNDDHDPIRSLRSLPLPLSFARAQ
jgi:4-hydroxybenzoate polyprenyltransferase